MSSTIVGALVGSLIASSVSSRFGRRGAVLQSAVTFTIGAIVQFFAWNYLSLVFGRTIVGLGIGIASFSSPVYIAEM